jgi:hypothetical protein
MVGQIDEPSDEDVNKYHALYIEKLQDLFERNKVLFGYPDRKLELF